MSYDFSFEKRQMVVLGVLTVLMALLLVLAGFLMGRISIAASSDAVPVPAVPGVVAGAEPKTSMPATPAPLIAAENLSKSAIGSGITPAPYSAAAAPEGASAAAGDHAASGRTFADAYGAAPASTSSGYALQYGAFRNPANAKDLMKKLADAKVSTSVVVMSNSLDESFNVVRSGIYPTLAEARDAAGAQANKLRMPIVVRPAGRL